MNWRRARHVMCTVRRWVAFKEAFLFPQQELLRHDRIPLFEPARFLSVFIMRHRELPVSPA